MARAGILLALSALALGCATEAEEWLPVEPPRGKVYKLLDDSTVVSDTVIAMRGGSATIGVIALDKDGAPVSGVKVLFGTDSGTYKTVLTDATGRAKMTRVVDSVASNSINLGGPTGRTVLADAWLDPGAWDGISGQASPVVNVTAPARYRRFGPLEVTAGLGQTIVAGGTTTSITVRVKDEFGQVRSNVGVSAVPLTTATALSDMRVNAVFGQWSTVTAANGTATFAWTPGNRIGVNTLRIGVNPANTNGVAPPDTVITVTQTVPANASFIMFRMDTIGTFLPPPVVGICRRIPVGMFFRMPHPTQGGQFVDLIGATNQITITRPATSTSCPGTTADKTTSITDIQGLATRNITIGGQAGTTNIAGAMGGKTSSFNVTGARFPAFAVSDTLRLALNVTQTTALTVAVTDTVQQAMNSMALTTGTLGGSSPVSMTDSTFVFWTSPTAFTTNASGVFTVNGVRVATVIEPGEKMFFAPTSTVPDVRFIRVPVKLTLPANATMTFVGTPPATVLAGALWTVTVRSRVPSPVVPMNGMKVTRRRTSGPASVPLQEQFASGVNGDAVFSYTFTTKGTYVFQFSSSYFPTLSTTVTVQ